MALEVYIPSFLEREKKAFKDSKGNHSIDYRSNGSTTNDYQFICDNIPYKRFSSAEPLDLTIVPVTTTNDTHVTGSDLNFRSFCFDVVLENTSISKLEFSSLHLLPIEGFKTKFNKIYKETESDGFEYFKIEYDILEYIGDQPRSTLRTLFESEAVGYPFTMGISINYGTGLLSSTKEPMLQNISILTATEEEGIIANEVFETEMIPFLDTPLNELRTFKLKSKARIGEGEEEEAFKSLSNICNRSENLFLYEKTPSIITSILPMTPLVTHSNNSKLFPPDSPSTLGSTSATNYRDLLAENMGGSDIYKVLRSNSLFTLLYPGSNQLATVLITNLKDKSYNYSPTESKIPKYRLYDSRDQMFKFNEVESATVESDITQVKIKNLNSTITGLELLAADDPVSNMHKLSKYGLTFYKTEEAKYIIDTLNKDEDIVFQAVTSSISSAPTSTKTEFGNGLTYTGENPLYSIKEDANGTDFTEIILSGYNNPMQYIDYSSKKLNTISNTSIEIAIENEKLEIPIIKNNSVESAGKTLRSSLKPFREYFETRGLQVISSPEDELVLRNFSSQNKSISITKQVIDTSVKGFNYTPEAINETHYCTVLSKNKGITRYNPLNDMYGEPFVLKVKNLTAENKYYLRVDISSNPDETLDKKETIIVVNEQDINILANRLNQKLRKYGVLVSRYDNDHIIFYQALGDYVVLDLYLYPADNLSSKPPQVSSLNIFTTVNNFPTASTQGLISMRFPKGMNNSFRYWYNEDNERQPMLTRTTNDAHKDSLILQLQPTANDLVLRCKLETDLESLEYNIVNINLPSVSLYTSNKVDYYNQLKSSIDIAFNQLLPPTSRIKIEVLESNSFKTEYDSLVPTNVGLKFTNLGDKLRQMKFAFSGDSRIFEVITDEYYAVNTEYKKFVNIFSEFSGVVLKDGISFWLNKGN